MSPGVKTDSGLKRWFRRLFGSDHHPTVREQYRSIGDQIEKRRDSQFSDWGTVLKEVRRVERLSSYGDRRRLKAPHSPERRA